MVSAAALVVFAPLLMLLSVGSYYNCVALGTTLVRTVQLLLVRHVQKLSSRFAAANTILTERMLVVIDAITPDPDLRPGRARAAPLLVRLSRRSGE